MNRLPSHRIPVVHSGFRRAILLLIPLIVIPIVVAHRRSAQAGINNPTGVISDLRNGYQGPPVELAVDGQRTTSTDGICLVAVRDGSSSVTDEIDPDRQVNKELGQASTAMASTSLDLDSMAAVVFADSANATPLLPIGDESIPQHLLTAEAGSGTDVNVGLRKTADLLAQCPLGSAKNVVLVTDGLDNERHIADGLKALPSDVHLDLVILETPAWKDIEASWRRANTTLNLIPVLRAGAVANVVAARLSELTGQRISVTYGATQPPTTTTTI